MRRFAVSFTSRETISDTLAYLKLLQTENIDLVQYRYLNLEWLLEITADFDTAFIGVEKKLSNVLLNKFSDLIVIELS